MTMDRQSQALADALSADVFELADWERLPEVFGNVARRKITIVGRQKLPPHEHNFAHAHVSMRGAVRLHLHHKDGRVTSCDYPRGSMFEVPKDVGHELESLSDDGYEGWCLFAVRDEDGGVAYDVTDAHRKDRFWHERLGGGDGG